MKLKSIFALFFAVNMGLVIPLLSYVLPKRYQPSGKHVLSKPQESQKFYSYLGRDYYDSIMADAMRADWAFPITISTIHADGSFNDKHKQCSLSNQIFGEAFTLQDIYLISRLSRQAKLSSQQAGFPGVFERPANNNAPFGTYGSDQYVGTLASLEIQFSGAGVSEQGFLLSLLHRWQFGSNEQFRLIAGASLPIKSVEHRFNYSLVNGNFEVRPLPGNFTVRSTPLAYFYKDFSSVEDFFIREVLGKKGICFNPVQRKTGIGDLNLLASIDIADYLPWYIAGCEFGVIGIIPTAGKESGHGLWEPILGNGGAFQLDIFAQTHFQTAIRAFNPVIRIAGNFSKSFINCHQRVAAAKSSGDGVAGGAPALVSSVSGLLSPDTFAGYYVLPFDGLDSTVAMFADGTAPVRIKYGNRFTFGIGNHVYNAFNLGFRLGMFYTYMCKSQDKACACDRSQALNTAQLQEGTRQQAHTVSWNLVYECENQVELSIGSQHIVAGKNVPQSHEWFATMALVF